MKNILLVSLGLIAVNIIIYAQVRSFDFVNYDDYLHVTDRPELREGLSPQGIQWVFTTTFVGNYIPTTGLTFLADYSLYGLHAGGYHLTNVLFHTLNTLLLFWVLLRLTSALWPSALVAFLFAVHPLHVESVAWISARKDVVSMFFFLLTIAAYTAYTRTTRLAPYFASLAFFAIGLLAKPMLVTLPCVLLLLDYWPLGRFTKDVNRRRVVLEKIPYFIVTVVISVVTIIVQRGAEAMQSTDTLGFQARAFNAVVAYLTYIGKMIFPANLIPFYPHPGDSLAIWKVIGAFAILVGITAACVRLRAKRPYLIVGWLWFAGTLVPVIGLVQVGGQAMADRYTYLTYTGLFIMVAWALSDLIRSRPALKGPTSAIVMLILAAFCGQAWVQTSHWRNSIDLFEHTVRISPENTTGLSNLGEAYLQAGRINEAIDRIEKVVELSPYSVGNRRNLTLAYRKAGRLDNAEEQVREALRLDVASPKTHSLYALVLMDQGQLAEAHRHLDIALRNDPGHIDAHINLGNLLLLEQEPVEAIRYYRIVLEKFPGHTDALTNLGAALLTMEEYEKAITPLREAIAAVPDDPVTRVNLAVALHEVGQTNEARVHVEHALRIDPDYEKAKAFLAFLNREPAPTITPR